MNIPCDETFQGQISRSEFSKNSRGGEGGLVFHKHSVFIIIIDSFTCISEIVVHIVKKVRTVEKVFCLPRSKRSDPSQVIKSLFLMYKDDV